MAKFPALFTPLTIKSLELKNRYVMPPMVTNYANTDGSVTDRLIDYFVARARGGAALLTVEASYVRPDGKGFPNEVGIHDDAMIPGLKRLVDEVHAAGSKMSIQIFHGGRQASSAVSGYQPVAPSPICCPATQELPRELPTEEVRQMVDAFGAAAYRARQAGFDAVEVHGAHGYLIAEFLSPFSNRRLDEYGGGIAGRARFAIEVVQKVRQTVGQDFPIFFRISGAEYVDGGLTLTQTKATVPLLIEAGIDAISVTVGNYATPGGMMIASLEVDQAPLVPLAEGIKQVSTVPVVAVDRLHDPFIAEQVLREGKADLIAIGRALLTDPELPNKAERGAIDEILLCISCNQACVGYLFQGKAISCLLNPACGREREFAIQTTDKPKKVFVVGGGPAGMEAARHAALRGHDVTLFEENGRLGGDFVVASIPHTKEELADAITWMIRHVQHDSIDVKIEMNKKVGPDEVAQRQPDVAIIATGAEPFRPPVPGIDRSDVVLAEDVLMGRVNSGPNALVVGGGLVGLDVAEYLVVQGKTVTIIEMQNTIGADLESYRRYWVMKTLAEYGTKFLTQTKLAEISDSGVTVEVNGKKESLGRFDTVIVATGYRPTGQEFQALRGKVPDVRIIGDAASTRTAVEAIYEGVKAGLEV